MEVFFHGLAQTTSEKRLRKYLSEKLRLFGIELFECEKKRRKTFATITLLDHFNGERFLKAYSEGGGLFLDKNFRCARSRNKPDPFKVRHLKTLLDDEAKKPKKIANGPPSVKQFGGTTISCGVWDYPDGSLTYVPYFMQLKPIRVFFGRKELVVMVDYLNSDQDSQLRMDVEYSSIHGLICPNMQDPSIMLTLYNSPRFYRVPTYETQPLLNNPMGNPTNSGLDLLASHIHHALRISDLRLSKRLRVVGLNANHEKVVGGCNVYQLKLSPEHVQAIRNLLRRKTFLPDIVNWPFRWITSPSFTYVSHQDLVSSLQNQYQDLDFAIKFQLQRLSQNLYLLPRVVKDLIPTIIKFERQRGVEATVYALHEMSKRIEFAGPETEAEFFDIKNLKKLLEAQDDSNDSLSPFALVRQYSHLVLVHRARVTPTAIYLEGPFAETKNSVLDSYSDFAFKYFLRASFEDENGEPLKREYNVDCTVIHDLRFKHILDAKIPIAGRQFDFLGFSHSSLREQSCWFCAPFIKDGSLVWRSLLIDKLGDFTGIRSPAKCAARIGQAFTDLNDTVPLTRTAIRRVSDIERNGRCFSDGCSTASLAVFRKLWKSYKAGAKPTLFQIRYAGIKGMISLDKSLEGEVFNVRPSQEKFPSDGEMLGVCGAAKRALPLYLNRQLIKVLEDLGISKHVFINLQQEAIDELRNIAYSPVNACAFLEMNDIGKSSGLAWLVRELYYLGIPALDDHFLWSAIELVLVMRVRDLKYKGRILIEDGVTLFGIMDETRILNEGEVYCALHNEDVILGRVIVTRSPVMHPGDLQYVKAVDVPTNSPLKNLRNCIVFSQQGDRDLPSQLSGGDLDGDIFNVIADARLLPPRTAEAADYPRATPIDIGRKVETGDITSFFINFMSNDQLGRISNLHLQFADQMEKGTESPECLQLANMHSVAVDFSKTGIPVDINNCPRLRAPNCKPDYMALGPRLLLFDGAATLENEDSPGLYHEDEDDILEDLDPEGPRIKHYRSEKVLGHLYRAIDEHQFLSDVQTGKRRGTAASQSALNRVLQYVLNVTKMILWDHFRPWALDIKEQYENALSDMMFANSLSPQKPLSEVEVFVGHVMGRNRGGVSKRAREAASTVREHFDELIRYTSELILKGDEESFSEEALERSIACLAVATENITDMGPRVGKLQSFGYLAATLCLRQVNRFTKDGF